MIFFQKRAVIWNRGDFRRFFKSGGRIKNQIRLSGEKTQSNGIGLQSIKNMMEKMTGKCAVMKEKNGFRITILFPVADS